MGQQRTDRASRHSHRQQAVRRRSRVQADRHPQIRQRHLAGGPWLNLVRRHSPLVLVISWVVLLGAAIAAVTAIVDPDVSVQSSALNAKANSTTQVLPSAQSESHPSPVQRLPAQRQKPPRSQTTAAGSPLSAGGALLVSCAGGCLLLSRCLHPQSPSRRRRTIPKLATKPEPLVFDAVDKPSRPGATLSSGLADASAPWPANTTIVRPLPEPHDRPAQSSTEPSLPETPVSVLAPDQSHPLDWNEPSLADSLDLRQKRPLSYWLRG